MAFRSTLYLTGLFLCLSFLRSYGQIRLTYPVDRQVVQRNNDNQASVQIAGSYSVAIDRVEARFVSLQGGQTTNWATLQNNPTNGQFAGQLTGQGGWYRIEVRGWRGSQQVGSDQLAHFGIGEVLLIFGHSNAQGTTCNDTDECSSPGGATDERVISVPFNPNTSENPSYGRYLETADPTYLPGLTFGQWTTNAGAAPFNSNAWLWGKLGDLLVQRLNVPVLFYGAGYGGTNMWHMYLAMNNQYFEHGFCPWERQMPYANVRNVMNLYVPSTGIRGILVTHGENDRYTSQEELRTYNREVMKQCRGKFSKDKLAWVLAISSYVSGRNDNVRNAQMQAVADINNDNSQARVFQGPDLDPPAGTTGPTPYRPDGLHYSTNGQRYYAQLWADNLTADNNAFFRNSTPYPAEQQPMTTIQCVSDYQLLLTQPAGYAAYSWNTGSTDQQYRGGAGYYAARLQRSTMSDPQSRDAMRFYFPPAIAVADDRKIPETPTLTASSPVACGNAITLTSSYAGPTVWNTGDVASSISVTASGTYSAKAKNAVYGCESPGAGSVSLAAGSADLSLTSQVSRRLTQVGDTMRLTVVLRNDGPCDVAGVQWQNRLPDNLTLESMDSDLMKSGTLLNGTMPLLPGTGSLSRSFVVRVNAPGTYVNAMQITRSPVPDPDSTPDSGTGDGQDDMTQVDFRTTTTASALYISANPSQTPLPAVRSNQPQPTANKADLSIRLQTSSRTPALGKPVVVSLVVTNAGGLTASNIGLRTTLPDGLQLVTESSRLNAASAQFDSSLDSLAAGASATFVFVVSARAGTVGTLQVILAEISRCDQPDPDSTPGNGAQQKGEDDEATAEMRAVAN